MRFDATTEKFELVELLGKKVLFTDIRIDKRTVPNGLYMYEIRHTDDDWGIPCQICNWVLVNFYGTILSKEMFPLEENAKRSNAYLDFDWDSQDGWYPQGECLSICEYLNEGSDNAETELD